MTFRQYMQLLAHRIGQHQLPIVENAADIHSFLEPDALHHDLVKPLVRQIYRGSRCGHLDAPLDRQLTLRLVTQARSELLGQDDTDICRLRCIDHWLEESLELLSDGHETRPSVVHAATR
jgi:hypothetical protein